MSFFDIAPEEDKGNFQVSFPDVGEFDKETLLAFEKETLGIYVSGHPMEAYQELWQKNVTARTSDFIVMRTAIRWWRTIPLWWWEA